ncbi:glycoside hydrolase family 3 protein [SAR86 cluster bacterium]|nr:glycoside hydrolase family 3 protein [SAR86 cluster bacterium]
MHIRILYIGLLFICINVDANIWTRDNSCSYPNFPIVDTLIDNMTIEQKVGQIIQPDLGSITLEEIQENQLGFVLNGGDTAPYNNKYATVDDWKRLSKEIYDASPVINGIKVPILWGTDAVHGHNNVIGATIFPHNIGLGATRNADLVRDIGKATALEVISTGVIWTFAPAITAPQDLKWGRTYEGYSEDSNIVSVMGGALIEGLQGRNKDFLSNNHILATAKHFIGDGGTFDGIDRGNTKLSEEELKRVHGIQYFTALDVCSQSVMASFNSWNGKKLHGHKYLLTDILKKQMNFDGFIIGDWNGHEELWFCSTKNCPRAFNAGVDVYMVPEDWKELRENLIKQIKSGRISKARLDEAVRRVLNVKARIGLFSDRKPHLVEENFVGSSQHKELARQAVQESLVLLKNTNSVLPINSAVHIGVIGSASQDKRQQMGGWTITWQNNDNSNEDFYWVSSILDVMKKATIATDNTIEFSSDGLFKNKPDIVIAVYGEKPYAEMFGDIEDIKFSDHAVLDQIKFIKSKNIPVVSIFISGRPLIVDEYIELSDAFIAAWLPGSEVIGISDLLFEEFNFNFKGKLGFSWPQDNNDEPIKYPVGYGLSYSSE